MTPQEFIENAPLYARVPIRDFAPPASITRMCSNVECRRETTWFETGNVRTTIRGAEPRIDVHYAAYECGLCRHNSLGVIYELLDWSTDNGTIYFHKAVRKVGQVPALDIAIAAELADRLGASVGYYRNALICRQHSYGIAAMAYMRRVVDEHTDNLIDVMVDLARTGSVSEDEIAKLVAAKAQGQYREKLKTASELLPLALKPGGVNPLGQLYKHASIGLHSKTDEECIAIFDELRADFEYVFRNLHLQAEERRQFAARIQRRAGNSQG